MKPEREAVEAASRRCAEDAIRLIEAQVMMLALEVIRVRLACFDCLDAKSAEITEGPLKQTYST
jgi:hypothetical protein